MKQCLKKLASKHQFELEIREVDIERSSDDDLTKSFFFPALPDECVTLSVNSGMRMKMRSKFPRQRTRKHNKKPNKHHKPNPKNKNPSAKPVVPREMQTR